MNSRIFEAIERHGLGEIAEQVLRDFIKAARDLDQFTLKKERTVSFEAIAADDAEASYIAACARNVWKEIEC